MSARIPRRIFARSLVVTLAVLPACNHEEPPPDLHETPKPFDIDPNTIWTVTMKDGKCTATLVQHCEQTSPCNPIVMPYECPAEVSKTASQITITKPVGSEECKLETSEYFSDGACPSGAHCNPPPPRHQTMIAPCPK